jgi:hypothetical protein
LGAPYADAAVQARNEAFEAEYDAKKHITATETVTNEPASAASPLT